MNTTSMRYWQMLADSVAPADPFVINIGAGDGVSLDDPCAHWLTRSGATGLALEARDELAARLRNNYPSARVVKHVGFVMPDTVEALFRNARVPKRPFVFKIDVDGYDIAIVQKALLLGYRPHFLYVEHAYNFPPGVLFRILYEPSLQWGWSNRDHVFGGNAAAWSAMLRGTVGGEYLLLGLLGNNMLFAHRSTVQPPPGVARERGSVPPPWAPSIRCAYEEGYLTKRAWFGHDTLDYRPTQWWRMDQIPRATRLQGMREYVNASITMQMQRLVHIHGRPTTKAEHKRLKKLLLPMPPADAEPTGSPPTTDSPDRSWPYAYPIELRLDSDDDGSVPLHGACAVDSCADQRITLRAKVSKMI